MLVKIITLLGTDNLNKSVKDHHIKVLRENPNIDKKDEVMTYIYALESDEFAKTVAEYQPSGAGGTRSPPATPHRLQHQTARLIQNCRRGLERGPILGYWALPSTFAK